MFASHVRLAAVTTLLFTAPASARKNIILDTDIFSDCDDAAALQMAATSPDVRLLGVNVNTNSSFSALAASSILAHYGHDATPVGAPSPLADTTFFDARDFSLGEFASKVAYHWSGGSLRWGRADDDALDPVGLYRAALSASEDGSVTIISLGFLSNLAALLDSGPDEHSDLPGPELVAEKVSELVIMGGAYPSGVEWNFAGADPAAAARVVNNWPGRMVFSGFELGESVFSGMRLMAEGPSNDPVRAAYIYYTYGKPRHSWDPLTVLYAIRGLSDVFEYGNENGYNHVSPDGSNVWVDDETVTNQHYLRLKLDNQTVGDELDRLYLEAAWMAENPLLNIDIPWMPRFPKYPKLEL
ncbi:inosine/uridine-preferring nucleoside hydrolase [Plectosphaerella cucumerina]|uniref:Inosine/uridine-preferring nucleoside hydrolase n=1 Tax=Plectosphaerella cucumerina TaxID=40658 RepID=A0A8K0TCY2_9PEZI|nr:inosine/uridine-preferring nucleoside hydrolase [Plectosphaerella cucumerina]